MLWSWLGAAALAVTVGQGAGKPAAVRLARPSPVQYAWHEQERIMFVCLGVPTWEGTEYDADGRTDLSRINPTGFDADALCRTARSWGAREILLVCKHVGGFCLWPTSTTDYSVQAIPWRHGKGNMVKEVADACRRHHLTLGIYIYPDDTRYTAAIGAGGKTDDPARQDEWSALLRKQWEEVLTLCGPDLVSEIWFDGSCVVPLADIISRLAPRAVIQQSPAATIRWVGNEAGIADDPNWNSLKLADLRSGVATQGQSTPDGDAWAPVECDVTLYNHNWFWNPGNERKRRSLNELLRIYLSSAGRGSVMLLNCTPNTDGRVPDGDVERYRELGAALHRNFGRPLATAGGVRGMGAELRLPRAAVVNCADLWEDYRQGHRIRAYVIEAEVAGAWREMARGTAVGRRKIDLFAPVHATGLRVRITAAVGRPIIRRFQAHRVDDALVEPFLPAVTRGCPAAASSVHSAPYEARFLVDGDGATRWGTRDADPDPWVEIDLGRPRGFARASASELADRVRRFRIECRSLPAEPWRTVYEGGAIGSSWSADFERTTARYVRFHVLEYFGPGVTLWDFSLRDRPGAWERVGEWRGGFEQQIDLSAAVTEPGQYELQLVDDGGQPAEIQRASLLFEGRPADARFLTGVGSSTLHLNRTQAVGDGAATAIIVAPRTGAAGGAVRIRPAIPATAR